jgi:DNA-3-methyladenine glycosylase
VVNLGKKLGAAFYIRADVVRVSRELLGKVLCTHFDGKRTEAVITETEAYAGADAALPYRFVAAV